MSVNSQIYVRLNGRLVIANEYELNYGERMVSRARYGIAYAMNTIEKFSHSWAEDKELCKCLSRTLDVDFDTKTLLLSEDILNFSKVLVDEKEVSQDDIRGFVFGRICCHGILFIDINSKRKAVRYAFTDNDMTTPLDAAGYMLWDNFNSEDELRKHLLELNDDAWRAYQLNKIFLSEVPLLTQQELDDFLYDTEINTK
jgi:hypothetical protein